MKLKRDENQNVVLLGGMPVYVDDEGREIPFDPTEALNRIAELERRLTQAGTATPAPGGQDKAAALAQVKDSLEAKVAELGGQLAAKDEQIRTLIVKNAFLNSAFIRERTVLPPSMAYSFFKHIFEVVEEGGELKAVAKTPAGEPIYSRADPSVLAGPDEAIEIYIMNYFPERDAILRGGQGGSGATGNQSGVAEPPKRISAADPRAFSRHLEDIASGRVEVV